MKIKRIVERLQDLLGAEKGKRRRQADEMALLLKRLRKKERNLDHALDKVSDPRVVAKLQRKLKVVRAHRRKGMLALQELRKK